MIIWMSQRDYYDLPYVEEVLTVFDGDIFLPSDYTKVQEQMCVVAHVSSNLIVTLTYEKVGFIDTRI